MRKADYQKIAEYYDKGRFLSEQNTGLWLNLIVKLSGARRGTKVLDLGCGTGRFSIPMKNRLGFNVTGADSSVKMLARAKQKDIDSEEVVQQTYQTGRAHLEAAQSRSTSVLSMISEESFQIGIDRLAEHIEKVTDDEWLLFDKMTLTIGRK